MEWVYIIIVYGILNSTTSWNSLISVIWLLVTFLGSGILILILGETMIGTLYIIIYVGALTVLFILGLMSSF